MARSKTKEWQPETVMCSACKQAQPNLPAHPVVAHGAVRICSECLAVLVDTANDARCKIFYRSDWINEEELRGRIVLRRNPTFDNTDPTEFIKDIRGAVGFVAANNVGQLLDAYTWLQGEIRAGRFEVFSPWRLDDTPLEELLTIFRAVPIFLWRFSLTTPLRVQDGQVVCCTAERLFPGSLQADLAAAIGRPVRLVSGLASVIRRRNEMLEVYAK